MWLEHSDERPVAKRAWRLVLQRKSWGSLRSIILPGMIAVALERKVKDISGWLTLQEAQEEEKKNARRRCWNCILNFLGSNNSIINWPRLLIIIIITGLKITCQPWSHSSCQLDTARPGDVRRLWGQKRTPGPDLHLWLSPSVIDAKKLSF